MATPAPHLCLRAAVRRFGDRTALGPVDLELAPGATVALAGPSGSGKSTLLRLLLGALAASAGEVRVDGVDTRTMSPASLRRHRRRCGLIDQEALILPGLSVHHNLVAGLVPSWPWYRVLASALWPPARTSVQAALDRVGLAERQWDRAEDLSGGQKQRVALARALMGTPAVICADEPTASLDPTTAAEIIALLAEDARRRGATLLISTHRLGQVRGAVERVIGLRAGRVVLDAAADEVSEGDLDALYEGSRERA
ncbi:phosphonate ABC transporter ATP-binding protein [Haliangium sp.]|uniref:phosphonate ABC transporter ATP-binding protein n=1 Tax=Haliangium sp. TaxID=2663208 RepID=UPI003D0EAD6F